ncbi:MAG: hypothetical protein RLZZ301_703 [Bacteroidota bacterium]|jgi:hypothetical protein
MEQRCLDFSPEDVLVIGYNQSQLQALSRHVHEPSKPFAFDQLKEELRRALHEKSLQQLRWFAPDFTLFPQALFDANSIQSYYHLNFGELAAGNQVHYQTIPAWNCVIIYSVPNWLYQLHKTELAQAHFKHQVKEILEVAYERKASAEICISLFETHFVLSSIHERKLQNCMAHEYQQSADILYFLLANFQQLKPDPTTELRIHVCHPEVKVPDLTQLITQFKDLQQMPLHFEAFETYQHQRLCASLEGH